MTRPLAVGQSLRRFDGAEKVTGATTYVEDLQLPRLAYARLVLSPHAHARIKAFDLEAARAHPGVVDVVTAADLALHRPNPASRADMVLARDEVLFVGQPVAAVVAETEAAATDAAQLVSMDYELLPAVVDVRQAMRAGTPLTRTGSLSPDSAEAAAHGAAVESATAEAKPRNVHTVSRFQRGDVEAGFRQADAVVEATYELAPVHQGFLETHATLAALEPDGGVRIWTATQGLFYARNETARLLGLPQHQVRVVPMAVGGGFGGKIVLLEPLVALLARRLRRPVRLTYTRTEEFLAGVPGPGAIIELKIGGRRDGSLTAAQARIHFDSGPFPSGPTGITAILIGGTYRIPHLDLVAHDVLTHRQPGGAYRAPGAPQAFFALEGAIDTLARQLQLDPLEFRLRNASGEGDLRPDGKVWPALGLQECLRQLQKHPLWTGRSRRPHEGYGLAVGGWGGGIEPAAAACRVNSDGTLTVQVGSVDISGTDTALAAIAADAFGLSTSQVRIAHGDSDQVPYAGMSGGSKITYVVGPAVLMAADDARRQVLAIAAEHLEAAPADLVLEEGRVFVRGVPTRSVPVGEIAGMSMQFAGRFIPVYGRGQTVIQQQSPIFGAHLAHVRVDPESGRVQVLDYLAVQDVGRAVNPPEVLGQIHGGVVQGIGRALFEQLAYGEDGQLLSTNFADYILPTATDVPAITVQVVEVPSPVGPYGAKGVGEPPCIPVAAAIANAVADATGCTITTVPMTPAVVRHALERQPNPVREEASPLPTSQDVETESNRFARRLFSGLGPGYDRLAAALSFGQDPRWRRFLVARVRVPPGGRALDVATGTAAVAIALARRYRCTVTGLDQSTDMLATGRERVARAQLSGQVTLQEGRAEQLPFPDAAFDAVTFTYLLRYVEDPRATLTELARVLKPGGRMAGLEFGVPPHPLWRAAWRLYTRAGLPLAGRLVSPSWHEVGRFLGPSIEEHYGRYPLDRLFSFWEAAGICDVQSRALSLGGGVVTWGVKGDGQPPPRSATAGFLRA